MEPSTVNIENREINNVSAVMKNWDDMQQQLHTANRQLKLQEAFIEECKSEIEFLQSSQRTDHAKCETRIHELDEHLALLRSTVSDLESELLSKDKIINKLEDEIRLKDECAEQQIPEVHNSSQEIDVILENKLLEQKCTELMEILQFKEEFQKRDQKLLEELHGEINEMKELLNFKKDEVIEKSLEIDKLNEQVISLQLELDTHKQTPLDNESRGNSLFAEVNDRRVYLQRTVDDMKSSYVFLQHEHSKHQKLIAQLRNDNAAIQARWKTDMEQIVEEHDAIKASLKNQIRVLTEINERQSKQLEEYPTHIYNEASPGCEFYFSLIEAKSVEIEKLESTLRNLTLSDYMMTTKLAQANKEIRQLKMANLELKKKIEKNVEKHKQEVDADLFRRFTISQDVTFRKETDPFEQSKCPQESNKCFDETLSFDNKENISQSNGIKLACEDPKTVRFIDDKSVACE